MADLRNASHKRRGSGVVERLGESADGLVDGLWVPGALPGETIAFERAKRGPRGRLLKVLTAAEQRVSPSCPHAVACGGCSTMHMERGFELDWKRERIARALEAEPTIQSGEALGYRTRARLHFHAGKGGLALGYRPRGGRHVLSVASCAVLSPALSRGMLLLRSALSTANGHGEVRLATGKRSCVARIETDAAQSSELYAALATLVEDDAFDGLTLSIEGVVATFGDPTEWHGALQGPSGGFAQANGSLNTSLVEHVVEQAQADGRDVLELYAGFGNFTVPLSARAREVVAVELNEDAVRCLRVNTKGKPVRAHAVDAEAFLGRNSRTFDVAVLDPPRRGAGPDVLKTLLRHPPKRIVVVACELRSLARDNEFLSEQYVREDVTAFDMFPRTAHLETVATYRLRGSS